MTIGVPREGVEPTTYALGEHRSILLSYRGLYLAPKL